MSASINRSLTTVKTELEFLKESNVITSELFDQIVGSLPGKWSTGMEPAGIITVGTTLTQTQTQTSTSTSNSKQVELAEAIYDYKAQESEDLSFKQGDKIQIIERTSDAWWKGTLNGNSGMFPSNYVKVLGTVPPAAAPPVIKEDLTSSSHTAPAAPPPGYYQQQLQPIFASPQMMPYPAQQQQQQPMMGQPMYNQSQQSLTPMTVVQSAPPQEMQQQQQQQHHDHKVGNAAKKFGHKLGNAAIFGAGASIGSNIVNSIF
ncbi:hypothetical protein CANARDRAFT_6045 [[Candida] arabinofermentans NRRL YB-2248]|uniref:SH3 domain-containing protein n=1 Tax=[Candida] arabinofermentans NRRL YB-2248 TaxID=983967 RepID=A0A1E4T6Y3_9ASCO|nr:hypothetical protein CANARDRAFT_6045 [[Candida] arabinofermentans NRRL YB-2248]